MIYESRKKAQKWMFENPVQAYVGKGEKASGVVFDLYDSLEKLLDTHAAEARAEQRDSCRKSAMKYVSEHTGVIWEELLDGIGDACLNATGESDDK